MEYKEFLNIFKLKGQHFMWFLGAGTSVSAGVPSASNLIDQFKLNIFCKNTSSNPKLYYDLSNPIARQSLQNYFIENKIVPNPDENEYAYYFEKAYPLEELRQQVIEKVVKGRSPSYGQEILVSLMKLNLCRIVWTTNFDKLIENAASKLYNTTDELTVSTLDSNNIARDAINNEKWPLLIKLHGDFQSKKIKNTNSELEKQDTEYRKLLIEQCQRYGLIVAGYSGRDESIMSSFREALENGNAFPHGLLWLMRAGEEPCSKLKNLIFRAKELNVNAEIINIQNFDEVMVDILKQIENIPDDIIKYLNTKMPKATFPPLPSKGKNFPVLRMNALPILEYPLNCKLIDCEIGGFEEIQKAIKKANTNIVAMRKKEGVIAFGQLNELQKTFSTYKLKSIVDYTLNQELLLEGKQELNLLYKLLIKCLEQDLPIIGKYRGRSHYIILDKNKINPQKFANWQRGQYQFAEYCYGKIPNTNIEWVQALKISAEFRFEQLWLILEPKIWVEPKEYDENITNKIKTFINSKYSNRMNSVSNLFLDKWINLLIGKNKNKELMLFQSSEKDISPKFIVNGTTAYSRGGE